MSDEETLETRRARADALEKRIHAILDEFTDRDVAVAARRIRDIAHFAREGLERREPALPPDTTGLARCSSRTRAGRDGRQIWCPRCGQGSRVYHFAWLGCRCTECHAMVDREEWWTAPVGSR